MSIGVSRQKFSC